MTFVSHFTEEPIFWESAGDLLTSKTALAKLRTLQLTAIAGFLLFAGLLFIFISWLDLRHGHPLRPFRQGVQPIYPTAPTSLARPEHGHNTGSQYLTPCFPMIKKSPGWEYYALRNS